MLRIGKPQKLNIPMVAAAVLFFLTLISIAMMSGFYAKYLSTGGSEDSARVATFEITASAQRFSKNLLVDMVPGVYTSEITVKNNSEVAVNYIITITNSTNNLPLEFAVDDSVFTFGHCNVPHAMAPGDKETYTLKIKFPQDGADQYAGQVDLVKVTLEAEQID